MKKILMLSSADSTENIAKNDNFVSALTQKFGDQFSIAWHHYSDISVQIDDSKIEVRILPENISLSSFDLIYFKSYYRNVEVAVTIGEYLQQQNIKFICSELKSYISTSKLSQYAKFARAGLPIPKTLYIPPKHLTSSFGVFTEYLGPKFVLKDATGKGGDANYLIEDETDFKAKIALNDGLEFLGQSFIPNDSDLRVLILNNEIKLVIKRQRTDETTHLNNTSQGAQASNVPLSELPIDAQQIALKSAQLLGREIAGADIMFDSLTKKPYLLEVNASPQVASGALVDEKVELYGEMFYNIVKDR